MIKITFEDPNKVNKHNWGKLCDMVVALNSGRYPNPSAAMKYSNEEIFDYVKKFANDNGCDLIIVDDKIVDYGP